MVAVDRFEAHISYDKGRFLVTGAALAGGAAVLAGLILSQPILVLASLVAFAVALYNYPLLRRNDAHLSASLHGLEIDGLGIVDWRSIETLALSDDAATPTVHCLLRDTLEGSLKVADDTSALRTVQVNIWRLQEPGTLVIDLASFRESPEEVLKALQRFHSRATS